MCWCKFLLVDGGLHILLIDAGNVSVVVTVKMFDSKSIFEFSFKSCGRRSRNVAEINISLLFRIQGMSKMCAKRYSIV